MPMRVIALLLPLVAAACAVSQAQEIPNPDIRSEVLTPELSVLFGGGGNIAVSHGPDGLVVIDDDYVQMTPKLTAALEKFGKGPARYVVNTHWHFDHSGGNAALGKGGALIVAHDNVRQRLASDQVIAAFKLKFPPAAAEALPKLTFADGLSLHLNGDTLTAVHVANAHTDGDALVKWEKANILHTGDVFVRYGLPFIDLSSGGSIKGMIAGVERALALSDARTRIIPGHGDVASRADLVAYRDMLVEIRDRVARARAEGRTLAEIKATKPAAAWDKDPKAYIRGDVFVEFVLATLDGPAAGQATAKKGKSELIPAPV
ncbi:glyoxylase-like metal-dependent hydrolase (beta-lactamase superfamily II) [Sphingomonas zeicaulis]|uniref:MBL fold metallo-hydrolase n=1 Tax=Sphingomonas zeicaulis TaxID=1632740 RepID=UPI003D238F91